MDGGARSNVRVAGEDIFVVAGLNSKSEVLSIVKEGAITAKIENIVSCSRFLAIGTLYYRKNMTKKCIQ